MSGHGWVGFLMFGAVVAALGLGYPVAFTLGGVALMFGLAGAAAGAFRFEDLLDVSSRVFGTMTNETLIAVPLFVFMGVMLERAKIAEELLENMGALFGRLRGGLLISVIVVGALMAASTGIVGATVVTMGVLTLPTLMKRGYDKSLTAGTICASGTLGQIIPPSIILVLLGDVLSSAYQQAQLARGGYASETVSVGDLFIGAIGPGLGLVVMYLIYVVVVAWLQPHRAPAAPSPYRGAELWKRTATGLAVPMLLILAVLGSIIGGFATPTEAAAVGGAGSLLLAALKRNLNIKTLRAVCTETASVTSMVFMILIGASLFSLVFNAYGGDYVVQQALQGLPGGVVGAMVAVMALMFVLGFVIDFIEIIFVVVPIVGPPLLMMGLDPVWLGVMMAVNLQTSFLTPPFGFALFYLRGVAPPEVRTVDIYRGVVPFILMQLVMLVVLAFWPELATWLPKQVYGD